MTAQEPQFLTLGTGAAERRIAYLTEAGRDRTRAGLMWLPGFKSEMTSLKATALADFARTRGAASTRFDYSGHGQSGGAFTDGTLSRWLEEARAVFQRLTEGPQVVVGSSMGGFIALLLLRSLMADAPGDAQRIRSLVLIAPAWNMTELMQQRLPPQAHRDIAETGVYLRPSSYGDGPYPITRGLLEDGARHRIVPQAFDPGRPVVILHGEQDPDVPFARSCELQALMAGGHVELIGVPDGDHRLSRPQDLDLLARVLERSL